VPSTRTPPTSSGRAHPARPASSAFRAMALGSFGLADTAAEAPSLPEGSNGGGGEEVLRFLRPLPNAQAAQHWSPHPMSPKPTKHACPNPCAPRCAHARGAQHAYCSVWQLFPTNPLLHHSKTQPSRLAHPGESRASGSGGPISSAPLREQQLPPPVHTSDEKQLHAPIPTRPGVRELPLA